MLHARVGARACAYICMYDYYYIRGRSVLVRMYLCACSMRTYMPMCVRALVRTHVLSLTWLRACDGAHVRIGV